MSQINAEKIFKNQLIKPTFEGKHYRQHAKQKSEKSLISHDITKINTGKKSIKQIFTGIMLILTVLILWIGTEVVIQVQTYHKNFLLLRTLKKEFRQLQIENQRLSLEQQIFSNVPIVTRRAINDLNMYHPAVTDPLIIQATPLEQPTTNSQVTSKQGQETVNE